jgi:hypothetical protein
MKLCKLLLILCLAALAGCASAPQATPQAEVSNQAPADLMVRTHPRVAQVPPQIQQAAPPAAEPQEGPLVVADQLYWAGPEGNLALDITAKFNDARAMLKHLDLEAPVGRFGDKDWTLRQIIVAADFNANGEVASWLISGPKPLVEGYLKALQSSGDTYDLSHQEVPAVNTAMMEGDEQ